MEDVFVLPERWKILDRKEVSQWASKTFGCLDGVDNGSFLCVEMKFYPQKRCYHFYDYDDNGHSSYTEISFDQFKQYVLGEKQQQKEIVGYKLKKYYKNCEEAAVRIIDDSGYHKRCTTLKEMDNLCRTDIDFQLNSSAYDKLKQAGVLDLWFTPVYKQEEPKYKVGDFVVVKNYSQCGEGNGVVEENLVSELFEVGKNGATGMHNKESAFSVKERGNYYNIKEGHIARKATPEEIKAAQIPQITINGYKGEFFDDYVKFGCAEIHRQDFIQLSGFIRLFGDERNTNKYIESVTIGKGTFTKEQIKEIAEFYLNK